MWFTSDNIPVVGTTNRTQLIVSAPDVALVLVEGEPVITAFRERYAAELEVAINLKNYCACLTGTPPEPPSSQAGRIQRGWCESTE